MKSFRKRNRQVHKLNKFRLSLRINGCPSGLVIHIFDPIIHYATLFIHDPHRETSYSSLGGSIDEIL